MTEAEIHDMTEQIDQRLGTVEVRQARLEASLENVIHEIGKMAAAVDHVVTMFQAMRPREIWSSDANWRARLKGSV